MKLYVQNLQSGRHGYGSVSFYLLGAGNDNFAYRIFSEYTTPKLHFEKQISMFTLVFTKNVVIFNHTTLSAVLLSITTFLVKASVNIEICF